MPERIPQSVAIRVPLYVVLSSDHISAATGKTVAITISKNGAAFGNPNAGATNATEIANGWYYVDLGTADTGTAGPLVVRGTSGSCDDATIAYNVVGAHNAGFDGVPAVAAEGAGGLYTRGSGAGQINQDANGRIDANLVATRGTASVGAVGYIGVDWGAVTNKTTTNALTGTTIGNVTVGGYASNQDPATLVLDVAASGHNTAGTIGAKINSAGGAADPWSVAVPGAYGAGTAGFILGTNLDTTVSSRVATSGLPSHFSSLAISAAGNVTVGGYLSGQDPATLVLDVAASGHNTAGTIGAKINSAGGAADPLSNAVPGSYGAGTAGYVLGTNLDVLVSSRSTFAGGAVASVTAGVTVTTNNDKAGYSLGASGLDAISVADPGAVSSMTTLPKMIVAVWRWLYKKTSLNRSSGNLQSFANDGSTVNTTSVCADDGTVQTHGAAQ